MSTSGPSSPSNLSSVTLVGSVGGGSVDKSDDTPTEEKNVQFKYGKAPKSPLPERKHPRVITIEQELQDIQQYQKDEKHTRTIISETITNIQPPTPEQPPATCFVQVETCHNGHSSSVSASPISPPSISSSIQQTSSIQTAIVSSAVTATAIVPHSTCSPPPSAIIISPSKTTNYPTMQTTTQVRCKLTSYIYCYYDRVCIRFNLSVNFKRFDMSFSLYKKKIS